jgi:hypothetical protein
MIVSKHVGNIYLIQSPNQNLPLCPTVRGMSEIEFRSRCLDDGFKSKSHFYIYLLSQLQHIYLHISGVILQNLDWLQLKFDFVSGTATISTEFSSGLKFPPISNETAA